MGKEFPAPIKNSQEVIKNSNDLDVIVVGKLFAELFKKGELTRNIIENKAKEINSDAHSLILTVLGFCDLDEEYLIYKKEKEGLLNKEEIDFSFLEKIQQKPEPAKVEQEPQARDVSVVPTAPTIIIEEEPQPVAMPSQAPEAQKLIGYEKTEEVIETVPKPERKNWWEVKRETEVMAVEDLDGRMSQFKKHVKKLGVAKEDASGNWHWTGENKKLVFLGDILGDRNLCGVEISYAIGSLIEQAEKQGGQVDFLCGNHDMALIHFLCKSGEDSFDKMNPEILTRDYAGVWELARFDPDPDSELKKMDPFSADFKNSENELWQKLFNKMPEIRAEIRNDPVGIYFLENICQIKVAVVHDDTLFCHTDPTLAMVSDLTKNGNISQRVAEVNKIFQENLRNALFNDVKLSSEFREIEKIYLATDNRQYFVEEKSFEKSVQDLLGKITEHLYKSGKINITSNLNKSLKEFGVEGRNWNNWKGLLIKNLLSIDVDEVIIRNNVESWKADNKIVGDYLDEVVGIINMFKNREESQLFRLEEYLVEKIKSLNIEKDNILKVRNSGINTIMHGHSPTPGRNYDKNDLVIVSPHSDFSDLRIKTSGASIISGISTVQKNGRIDLIGKSFRVKKPV